MARRVARRVLSQLRTGLYRALYVSLSTGNVMDLLKTISWEMGLSVECSRATLYRQIKTEVTRLCGDARTRPMHGPTLLDPDDRRRHKTYLIALLDDATRLILYAAFTRSETVTAFLPVFEWALLRRSIAKRLYVDNGSSYRARHLALVCAKLGVTLIHVPVPGLPLRTSFIQSSLAAS